MMGRSVKQSAEPIGYSPETVLTIDQLAAWLQISKRAAERLHIPCFYLGTRTRRYLGKSVMEYLEKRVG